MSAYFQYALLIDPFIARIEDVLASLPGADVVVGADANARLPMWGGVRSCRRGLLLERLVKAWGLDVLNVPWGLPTHVDGTVLDCIQSDHRLITFTLDEAAGSPESDGVVSTRYNLRKADWEAAFSFSNPPWHGRRG